MALSLASKMPMMTLGAKSVARTIADHLKEELTCRLGVLNVGLVDLREEEVVVALASRFISLDDSTSHLVNIYNSIWSI